MGVEFGVLVDVRGGRYGEVGAEVAAAEGLGAWAEAAPGIAYLEGEIASYGGNELPVLRQDDYLVGTPDDVVQKLIALHAETRFVEFAHWMRLPGMTHEVAMQSLELVARYVVPGVRAGVGR